MSKTSSTMLALGTQAPDFCLPDKRLGVDPQRLVKRDDFLGKPLVVMFICNHCPFVKHLQRGLAEFGQAYAAAGVGIVAINANDIDTYPDDAPDKMAQEAKNAGYTFPYLLMRRRK